MAENVTPVTLEVKDFKAREVILVDYKFNQATDREGQISGIPRGGRVNIRVKALNDGTPELAAWMCDRFLKKDGEIQFLETKTGKAMKTIKFVNTVDGAAMKELKGTGCYCVKYKEYWADGEEHYEDIEIVCQKLENGPVAFENPWK